MAYGYAKYILVFTSVDYYTYYKGSIEISARTENEAIKLARKKLNIPDYHTHTTCEVVYGPYSLKDKRT